VWAGGLYRPLRISSTRSQCSLARLTTADHSFQQCSGSSLVHANMAVLSSTMGNVLLSLNTSAAASWFESNDTLKGRKKESEQFGKGDEGTYVAQPVHGLAVETRLVHVKRGGRRRGQRRRLCRVWRTHANHTLRRPAYLDSLTHVEIRSFWGPRECSKE